MSYASDILTEKGYRRKLYPEILEETENRARQFFGEDVDLADDSPVGQLVKQIAYIRAEDNELGEYIYLAQSIDNAEGDLLDFAVKSSGMTRFTAKKARGEKALRINVEPGTILPLGFIVYKGDISIQYVTIETTADADNDGFIDATIEAVMPGSAYNAEVGEITGIGSPTSGVISVTNSAPVFGGRLRETDSALRARYYKRQARSGSGTTASIEAALLDLSDVRAALVVENDSDQTDDQGRPPHSISSVVLGGQPEEIAKAILGQKAGGIQAFGDEVIVVKDASGREKKIGFSYAETVGIEAQVSVKVSPAFPEDGFKQIQTQIIQVIGGVDAEGVEHIGSGMGEDIIYSRIIRAIQVPGIVDLTLGIRKGSTGNFTQANIEIEEDQVAETNAGKVVVSLA